MIKTSCEAWNCVEHEGQTVQCLPLGTDLDSWAIPILRNDKKCKCIIMFLTLGMHNKAFRLASACSLLPVRILAADYPQFNLPSCYSSAFTRRSDPMQSHWGKWLSINLQLASEQLMPCGIISSPSLVNNQLFMRFVISKIRRLQGASDDITRLLPLPIGR